MSSITCPNTACGAVLEGSDLRHCPRCGSFLPLAEKDPADPLVGQPILGGKYRILSVIGEGGMGKVYLAEQKLGNAHRKVAIKTLQPDLAQDPQIIARFHRETQTVIELEHPNTIKFYDFGELEEHGKKLFVVMEFIQGESLAHVLARGSIDVARAERIMAQICGSLQEAHDHGIVHRDLKPENIYLTQKGARGDFVKVLDFGIAKRGEAADDKEAKLTRQGMVLGTPPYMSPEQFTGQALDGRSDIYALAVMAYQMLTAELPFTAATPWEWATKHLTAPPIPIEQQPNGMNVPPRHRMAIMRGLAKKREERQASVTQFLQEFAGHSEGATDWTASSTSLPGTSNPGVQPGAPYLTPPPGPGGFGSNPTMPSNPGAMGMGMPPQGSALRAPTPNPFMVGQGTPPPPPGFVPSPSSAGFAGVPPSVAPGMAGSNPSFPQPSTGGFGAVPGMPYAPPAPVKKSRTGLIIGIVLALAALGGGGWAVNYFWLDDDDDDAPTQQQAQQQTAQQQAMQGTQLAQAGQLQPVQNIVQQRIQPIQQMPIPTPQQVQPQQGAMQPAQNTVQNQQPQQQPTQQQPQQQPTQQQQPSNNHGSGGSQGGGGDPRVASYVSQGMSAVDSGHFGEAINDLQSAAHIDPGGSGVGRLRSEIRRRGRNRIDNLILGGNCGGAQALYRDLRSAGAAPGTESFGDACPAP